MNCKNIEPLLSLYPGSDLEEEQSRLVATHLQSCTECAFAADEYARVGQLLQVYEPPVFSDESYAGIREQVLNDIERESHVRVWPGIFSQLFLVLVQPRMRWITAALILAISVTALYFSRNPSPQLPNPPHVAVRMVEPNQVGSGTDVRSAATKSAGSSSFPNQGPVRTAIKHRPISRKREARVDVARRFVDRSQPSSAAAPLRLEMQTSDRNIRIIWLSGVERPGALGTNGSKAI
jgi:hypothetical protein